MEVILKEDVPKLGHRGDVVKVAEGYGRNYLLPKKLAIEATLANKAVIEQMKAASLRRTAKEKEQAEQLAKQFEGVTLTFTRRAGEHDQLFGSVTTSELADALAKRGLDVDRRRIELDQAIKTLGEFQVPIRLHREVIVKVKAIVEKEATGEEETAEETAE
ncbi:MAG TPA: 50S ribosomal protein L9 [Terriglobales bacterium]|jgi:large subunit ribosomal protein L9|nr:50S ribosomal protein L9 [Terriglobales bacterium]